VSCYSASTEKANNHKELVSGEVSVHPKTAQPLARHSTITLTMYRYSHTGRDDEFRALSALPNLSQSSDNGESPAAELDQQVPPFVSADCLLEKGRFRDTSVDSE
jgi:hypothetical protein